LYNPNEYYVGSEVLLAGWGIDNSGTNPKLLQTATVKVISNAQCESKVFDLEGIEYSIPNNYLCSLQEPYTSLANVSFHVFNVAVNIFLTLSKLSDALTIFSLNENMYSN
jgi:hypothetical protein